jgi:hypothetical protein
MANDKLEKIVAVAYKKALQIVEENSPPDSNSNSKIIAASYLTPILIEIDLDDNDDVKEDETNFGEGDNA